MPRQNFEADPAKAITKLPMVVLTNRGTADAAEVAAAALLDNKRAELVGERTYGDASERRAITMEDGGAIILSVAKYYSPERQGHSGRRRDAQQSDERARSPGGLDENGEPLPGSSAEVEPRKAEDDPLLKKAVEMLEEVNERTSRSQGSRSVRTPCSFVYAGISERMLQRLQIRDQVVFLLITQDFFIGRHTVAAFVDFGATLASVGFFPFAILSL